MAKSSIGLEVELIQKLFSDPDRMREVMQLICQSAMNAEVSDHLGADRHERSEGRRGHRNGHKPRTLKTRVGELELEVPQVRDYIIRPPEHHMKQSFQDELREWLRRYQVAWDERYIWDRRFDERSLQDPNIVVIDTPSFALS